MKKIRNVENPFEFETVVFSFSEEQILRELIAESSYVAKSLVGQSDLKSGWSRSIIFSEDDKPFLSRWLADARDEMMRSLSAYLSDESVSTETTLVFAVLLSRQRPLALDESICHQLERAIVHHVLNQWFATKQPEESVRRQLQYKGAMSAVKSDIRLAVTAGHTARRTIFESVGISPAMRFRTVSIACENRYPFLFAHVVR